MIRKFYDYKLSVFNFFKGVFIFPIGNWYLKSLRKLNQVLLIMEISGVATAGHLGQMPQLKF
jgi:hypothetical protein